MKIQTEQPLADFLTHWWAQIDKAVSRERKVEMLIDAATILWGGCQNGLNEAQIREQTNAWLETVNPM